MDQLIELIFDNLFFVVIIIGAIFSMFKGKDAEDEGQQETRQRQRTEQPQQVKTSPNVRKQRKPQSENPYVDKQEVVQRLSVEEHRAEQMKKLGMRTEQGESMMIKDHDFSFDNNRKTLGRSLDADDLTSSHNQAAYTGSRLQKNLTSEGLVNSVVMAEVLGAPRSREPYQSVIAKRRAK